MSKTAKLEKSSTNTNKLFCNEGSPFIWIMIQKQHLQEEKLQPDWLKKMTPLGFQNWWQLSTRRTTCQTILKDYKQIGHCVSFHSNSIHIQKTETRKIKLSQSHPLCGSRTRVISLSGMPASIGPLQDSQPHERWSHWRNVMTQQ